MSNAHNSTLNVRFIFSSTVPENRVTQFALKYWGPNANGSRVKCQM